MVRAARPLHPKSARFCAANAKASNPGLSLEGLATHRADYDLLLKQYPATQGITTVDIAVPNGKRVVPCRLYKTPSMANPVPRPVVLYFHGGGHTIGSVGGYDNFCKALCAAADVQILSVDYRLSPEHKFLVGIEDCYKVLRWVVDGLGSGHGLDGDRVALAGDSAGGNATAVLCLVARDDGVAGKIRFALALNPELDSRPTARRGVVDPEASVVAYEKGHFLTMENVDFFLKCTVSKEADLYDWRLSPIVGNLSGLPRMHLISAGYDPLRDEAEAFTKLARAAGSPVEHECQEDEFHCWFLQARYLRHAREAVPRFGRMLREGLGLPPNSRL